MYYFLRLAVNIVDRSFLEYPIFVSEGMEDWDVSKGKAVSQLIVIHETILLKVENEVSFSQRGLLVSESGIYYKVIVVDSMISFRLAFVLILKLIGDRNQHVFLWVYFP